MTIDRQHFFKLATAASTVVVTAEASASQPSHHDLEADLDDAYGVLVDTTFCIGCQKCERGCNEANAEKCIGCRYCMAAYPFQIPGYEYAKALQPRVMKCGFCAERIIKEGRKPACVENCPNEALTFERRRELRSLAHQKTVASPGRYLDHLYGETEVGGTSWMHLTGIDFARADLPQPGSRPVPELTEKIQHGVFKNFVPPLALFGLLGLVMASQRSDERPVVHPGHAGAFPALRDRGRLPDDRFRVTALVAQHPDASGDGPAAASRPHRDVHARLLRRRQGRRPDDPQAWPLAFAGGSQATMFWVEMVVGILLPLALFASPRVRTDPRGLFVAAALTVAGVAVNRLNVFLVAYRPPFSDRPYFPTIYEMLLTAGLVATLVLVYRAIVMVFPVIAAPHGAANDHAAAENDRRAA